MLAGDLARWRRLLDVSTVWDDPRPRDGCGGPAQIQRHFLEAEIQANHSCLGIRHMVVMSLLVVRRRDRQAVEGSLGKDSRVASRKNANLSQYRHTVNLIDDNLMRAPQLPD